MATFLSEKRAETTGAPAWTYTVAGWALSQFDYDLMPRVIEGPGRVAKFSHHKPRPSVLLPTLESRKVFVDVLIWVNSRGLHLIRRREPFMPGFYERYARGFVRIEISTDDFIDSSAVVAFGSTARAARELSELDWSWPEGKGPGWYIRAGKPYELRREIQELRSRAAKRLPAIQPRKRA